MEFHHVKRHADGARSTPEEVKAVCKPCHVKLHS
ncbi:HNH endonuclease [Chitinophaga sancti]